MGWAAKKEYSYSLCVRPQHSISCHTHEKEYPPCPFGLPPNHGNPLSHATKILPVSSAPWAAIGISEGHFPDSSPSSTIWAPPVIIVINTINHSYWTYFHQLSYRTGASHCNILGISSAVKKSAPSRTASWTPRWDDAIAPISKGCRPCQRTPWATAQQLPSWGTFSLIPPSGQTWLAGRLSHLVPFRNILKLPLNIFHVLLFLSNRFSMFFHIVLCFFACCGLGLRPMTRS